MIIKKCPICGRQPTVRECVRVKHYRNGIRRRICGCPNYCSVIPYKDRLNRSFFEFDGEGDDNAIFKVWNTHLTMFDKNKTITWPNWNYIEGTEEWK